MGNAVGWIVFHERGPHGLVPSFTILLRGTGCRVNIIERRFRFVPWPMVRSRGFYASRVAEGESADEASEQAIRSVRDELHGIVRNTPEEPWVIVVETVEEMPGTAQASDQEVARRGFTWFPEQEPD